MAQGGLHRTFWPIFWNRGVYRLFSCYRLFCTGFGLTVEDRGLVESEVGLVCLHRSRDQDLVCHSELKRDSCSVVWNHPPGSRARAGWGSRNPYSTGIASVPTVPRRPYSHGNCQSPLIASIACVVVHRQTPGHPDSGSKNPPISGLCVLLCCRETI